MKKPAAFLFFKEESSNVFNPLYINYLLHQHTCPASPMDNDWAPFGAASWQFILRSLI
jgi:hypothetical protein